MALVLGVLLPACFWLYQSRTSRAAMERFRATQGLETGMNRALLLHLNENWSAETPNPGYLRFEIHPVREGSETRLLGTAKDRKGRVVSRLEAGYFGGKP